MNWKEKLIATVCFIPLLYMGLARLAEEFIEWVPLQIAAGFSAFIPIAVFIAETGEYISLAFCVWLGITSFVHLMNPDPVEKVLGPNPPEGENGHSFEEGDRVKLVEPKFVNNISSYRVGTIDWGGSRWVLSTPDKERIPISNWSGERKNGSPVLVKIKEEEYLSRALKEG